MTTQTNKTQNVQQHLQILNPPTHEVEQAARAIPGPPLPTDNPEGGAGGASNGGTDLGLVLAGVIFPPILDPVSGSIFFFYESLFEIPLGINSFWFDMLLASFFSFNARVCIYVQLI